MSLRRIALVVLLCVAPAAGHADPGNELPNAPSRTAVVDSMNRVAPAVAQCGGGWTGLVPTRFVFRGATGRAENVSVTGGDVPPRVARCVERAAGAAFVPPFRMEQFSVNYPFRIP